MEGFFKNGTEICWVAKKFHGIEDGQPIIESFLHRGVVKSFTPSSKNGIGFYETEDGLKCEESIAQDIGMWDNLKSLFN